MCAAFCFYPGSARALACNRQSGSERWCPRHRELCVLDCGEAPQVQAGLALNPRSSARFFKNLLNLARFLLGEYGVAALLKD